MKIKRLRPEAIPPRYATDGACAFDLFAPHNAVVPPSGCMADIGTGWAVQVPAGYALLVFSRSGHGFKRSVRLVNSVGVIDADFRGEIRVGLRNDGTDTLFIRSGDAIAQAMLVPAPHIEFEEVQELPPTARGEGGFGSTDRPTN